jgi:hypothetical protein
MTTPDDWTTSNLALATYLIIVEQNLSRIQWDESFGRSSCQWVFEDTEELADYVADFEGGNARVDPKSFNFLFGRMKREMMEAMPQR